MRGLFVDTAGWQALEEEGGPASDAARDGRDDWIASGGILVTTDYIVDEIDIRREDGSYRE